MQLTVKKIDVSLEKRILTGFIVSTEFIKKIHKIYDKNFLTSPASRKIAKWCIEYFIEYNKAPNKHIQDIYIQNKRKNNIDEDEQDFIEKILSSLSDEWEVIEQQFNPVLLIEQCVEFFNEKHLTNIKEEIDALIDNKDIQKVQELLSNYKPITVHNNYEYYNPLSDEEGMREAFKQKKEPLFKLPGALGKMMNSQLYRGGFIGIQAPEKSAKSFLLQEFVMRALRCRVKVALFELGDLTKADRYCRMGSYVARLPFNRDDNEEGLVKCKIPELIDGDDGFEVKINEMTFPLLTEEDAIKAGKKWIKRCGADCLRVSIHSSDSTSISDVNEILHAWYEEDGWVPGLVAIDYPDIAAKEKGNFDERSASNARWKGQRRISQDWNALVISVTQADAKSYGKASQSLKNFSEDKRKYSHITAMYAINQTFGERAQNIFRVAPLLVREGENDKSKHVAVVHCLDLGRPYMFSYYVDASKFLEGEDDDD